MTSRDFCYWLQGVFEIGKVTTFDAEQTGLIRRHLALVFLHEIDPSAGPPEKQAQLDEAHTPKRPEPAWISQSTDLPPGVKARC